MLSRHEEKYLLTYAQYAILRQRVTQVLQPDKNGEGGTYTITGYLVLCEYTVADNGLVTVSNAKVDDGNPDNGDQSVILTKLGQNVATAVSAMVYLDGSNLTNADMLTSGQVEGKLNLQFASDANLVPMNNNDLYQGETQNP